MSNMGPWNPENLPTDEFGAIKKRKTAVANVVKPTVANLNFEDDEVDTSRMYGESFAY